MKDTSQKPTYDELLHRCLDAEEQLEALSQKPDGSHAELQQGHYSQATLEENYPESRLRYLDAMYRINRAFQSSEDLNQRMSNFLDEVLTILSCDRAFLLVPCDPKADFWFAPMERTKPEYPGVLALNVKSR